MAKLTLEEKRLKSLKLQLFGKEQITKSVPKTTRFQPKGTASTEIPIRVSPVETLTSTSYVKSDLTKIALLVAMAMSIQLILYFASLNNLIKLNFF